MKDKTLKKLKRSELLELLLEERRINEGLQQELAKVKAELDDKQIRLEKAGNIAEASLALTEIFAEAQKAADLYLANVKRDMEISDSDYDSVSESASEKPEASEPSERLKQAAEAINIAFSELDQTEAAGETETAGGEETKASETEAAAVETEAGCETE